MTSPFFYQAVSKKTPTSFRWGMNCVKHGCILAYFNPSPCRLINRAIKEQCTARPFDKPPLQNPLGFKWWVVDIFHYYLSFILLFRQFVRVVLFQRTELQHHNQELLWQSFFLLLQYLPYLSPR